MMRLKIAHVVPYYSPSIGGVEFVCKALSEGLSARGHSVDVLTSFRCNQNAEGQRLPPTETMHGVQVRRFRHLFAVGHMSFFPGAWTHLLRGNYHIVHMHAIRHPHTLLGGMKRLNSRCATLLQGHAHFDSSSALKALVYRMADMVLFPMCYRRLSGMVAITESEKQEYVRRGMEEAKITLVPNGVPDEFFQPSDSAAFRRKHKLYRNPIILFIGRLQPAKRIDLVIRALPKITHRVPDAVFVAVGPDQGTMMQLLHLADTLNVRQSVRFLGQIEALEIRQAIAAADVVVLPSDYEAFGRCIVEAMAAGRPVVAARSPGPSEIIRHGVTGYLFDSGDHGAIERHVIPLLERSALTQTIGDAARCAAEKYRMGGIIHQVENVYMKLVTTRMPLQNGFHTTDARRGDIL